MDGKGSSGRPAEGEEVEVSSMQRGGWRAQSLALEEASWSQVLDCMAS